VSLAFLRKKKSQVVIDGIQPRYWERRITAIQKGKTTAFVTLGRREIDIIKHGAGLEARHAFVRHHRSKRGFNMKNGALLCTAEEK